MMGYQNFWKVLNAKDYGVPQNRERVFVVSILGCGQYLFPNPIKLEKRLKDVLEPVVDEKYYISNKMIDYILGKQDKEYNFRVEISNPDTIRETPIRAAGDLAVVGEPLALDEQNKCIRTDGTVGTLTTDGSSPKHNNRVIEPVCVASRGRENGQELELNKSGCTNTITSVQKDNYVLEPICIGGMQEHQSIKKDGIATCLTSSMGTGGGYVPMVTEPNIIEEPFNLYPNSGNPQAGRVYNSEGISPAMDTCSGGNRMPKITENLRIRKLTPRECFRLMGVRDEQFDKLHNISNSQLYKLAGNSIVVDVLMGIFKNLLVSDEGTKGQLTLF
jgi:DNA (cytosine-5)-methyltransferase 1